MFENGAYGELSSRRRESLEVKGFLCHRIFSLKPFLPGKLTSVVWKSVPILGEFQALP